MNLSTQNIFLAFITFLLLSCGNDRERLSKIEKECVSKTKIDGFTISFFGYFPKNADSVQVQIKRGNHLIKKYTDKIPEAISDSLRHLRNYSVQNEILLTDTVFVKIKNEPAKKIYGFKYLVRPHHSMMNKDWGCDFYELIVDRKISTGASVDFTNKNWRILEKKDFGKYYKE